MFDNKWQKKEMPLVSLIGMGGGIASPAFLAAIILNILKPTILSPEDDTGVPDFDYTAESSAITNTSSLTTLDDFTSITSRTGQYEYIVSDQNGSVFVTADVSSSNYFEISTDGGATWSNSNTVSSWAALRAHCFVDSPTYKGFIFGSVLSGMGGDAPTYKSSQGNYLSWSQAGTIPSYQSDRGRYDAFATDNTGFILACGAYSNVAYSTNNADSWTRVSPGSGGTNTSLPHWTTCTYFAKLGKYVIGGNNQSSAGNKVYLSGDTSQVQSGSWTIHDSASNPPGFDDMACNDDYLFAVSFSSSSVWRTSDLTSWTQIADFSGTDISPYTIKVKGSIILLSDFSTTGNTGDVIASSDGGANWIYKKINSGDTFGSFDAAIDKDNNIVAVNDRKSPRVARTTLNATTTLTLTDTTVSKVLDGSLVEGESIDQVLTAGETVQADTAISSTSAASVFSTTLYNGNGQSRDLDTGIDNTDKSLIWFKNRNYDYPHILIDTVRGFSRLSSNNTQLAYSSGIDVTSFNDSGVSLTNATGWVNHPSGHEMVAWNFRAAPGFFDVVSYTGDGTGSQDISHNLGTTPGMIIVKRTDTTEDWWVYHSGLDAIGTASENDQLKLNTNDKAGVGSFRFGQIGVGLDINSSSFTVGGDDFGALDLNQTNATYVAYVFAEDTSGLIKCGSYTSTSQPMSISCGFEPGWLMIKRTNNINGMSSSAEWIIIDNQRGNGKVLKPNESSKESNTTYPVLTSDGFELNNHTFASGEIGGDFIYVAIAQNAEADITTDIYASGTVSASSGNAITLSNTTGTWSTGMKIQGVTTDTKDNPDPISSNNVSLTSSAPTAERNVSTWGDAIWEVATDENFTQNVQTATTALSATGTQAGPSFVFEKETGYYARTKYTALGQESEWSDVTYFVTAPSVYVDDVFSTYLYYGTTDPSLTINNGIDLSGEGGLVWIKQRNGQREHHVFDTERGATKYLNTNIGGQEQTNSETLTSFTSSGFILGDDTNVNHPEDFVSWTFRKAPKFFDVVTYNGNGSTQTISHNLGSVPGMIMVKRLNSSRDWAVYHRSLGNGQALKLNDDSQARPFAGWGYTTPTSSEFYLGNDSDVNNAAGTYVAYLFAHDDQSFGTNGDESVISCGTFNATSGTQVNLGWEPQFLLAKNTTSNDWSIVDTMRGFTVENDEYLLANEIQAGIDYPLFVPTPTGFTVSFDSNNDTYIYMAIRRPHKPATSSSEVFAVNTWGGTAPNPPAFGAGFPVDMVFHKIITSDNGPWEWSSRLTETKVLGSHSSGTESTDGQFNFDYQTGAHDSGSSFSNHYSWLFKRSPGFFDIVTYTGNNSTRNINHNLQSVPEMIIYKARDAAFTWQVYHKDLGENERLILTDAESSSTNAWNSTTPTSSVFTLSNNANVNYPDIDFIAYLFGSQPGISKVGSYVGNGYGAQSIDCGFTNGAAFILVKNADSSGDWYLLDSERGINAYNETEPYLTLNTKNQEQTANVLGYHNTGFMLSGQYGTASLNTYGEKYIFLAIANP